MATDNDRAIGERDEEGKDMGAHGVLIEVRNRSHLVRSYGEEMAESLEHEIAARAREICGEGGHVTRLGKGRLAVRWESARSAFASARNTAPSGADEPDIDGFVLRLCGWASRTPGISFAVLSAKRTSAADVELVNTAVSAREPKLEPSPLRKQIMADMDTVAMIGRAIENDQFVFEFQPVRHVERHDRVLYRECLLRLPSAQPGETMLPGAFIPTLERLGLMRTLDRYVVKRVVKLLRERPDLSLGVNISAQSAIDDGWWASMLRELASEPGLAQRLVIEITETAPLRAGCGRVFADRLRQLGCRIAIDDFGVGYGVETGIEIRSPDIIKVDGSFLYGVGTGQYNAHPLAGMVSLASEMACDVIVEGVESEAALRLARKAGALWAQGHYVGVPDVLPLA